MIWNSLLNNSEMFYIPKLCWKLNVKLNLLEIVTFLNKNSLVLCFRKTTEHLLSCACDL